MPIHVTHYLLKVFRRAGDSSPEIPPKNYSEDESTHDFKTFVTSRL